MSWRLKFLSKDEEQTIEARIKKFEDKTNTDLILCINKASDPYPAAVLRFAILGCFISSFFSTIYIQYGETYYLILLQVFVLITLILLGRIHRIKRLFLVENETTREVEEKSVELFYLLSQSQSSHQAQVFFLISLLERKFKLLIGEKIQEKITNEDLEELVKIMQSQFRKNHFSQGCLKDIECLEEKILKNFPDKVLEKAPKEMANTLHWLNFS